MLRAQPETLTLQVVFKLFSTAPEISSYLSLTEQYLLYF